MQYSFQEVTIFTWLQTLAYYLHKCVSVYVIMAATCFQAMPSHDQFLNMSSTDMIFFFFLVVIGSYILLCKYDNVGPLS